MRRGRLLVILALVIGVAALGWRLRVAWAAVPSGCVYPNSIDTFQAIQPGDVLESTTWNKFLCALLALEREVEELKDSTVLCQTVSVPAATRQEVTFTVSGSLSGNEAVFLTVKDANSPNRMMTDGVGTILGSTIKAYVFNRDPDSLRLGRMCARVER